jgi:hypothetical protein
VLNVRCQQSITSDENVVFNYLFGLKIRNITKGKEDITNGYVGSLITSETFIKTGASPIFNKNQGPT